MSSSSTPLTVLPGEPYAHPVRADRVGHRLGDLRREPHPPLHRPAVAVRPAIGVPGEELVQQMPVGRVHLDALEARFDGPAGGGGEVVDGGPDVGRGHLPGHDGRPVSARSEDRLRKRYGGGCDGRQARGRRMADPAAVLELEEHPPAGRPHGLGHPPPAGRVPVGVERGDVRTNRPQPAHGTSGAHSHSPEVTPAPYTSSSSRPPNAPPTRKPPALRATVAVRR